MKTLKQTANKELSNIVFTMARDFTKIAVGVERFVSLAQVLSK